MNTEEFPVFLRRVLPSMGFEWRRFDRRNIRRKVRRRMESIGIHEAVKYALLLEKDPAERAVFECLLRVTVTRFFRNSWLWEELAGLLSRDFPPGAGPLSAWSAGCAGGEEPFSLAMLLEDLSRRGETGDGWSILGTDTDPASLERARTARYLWGSVREVPLELRERWFSREEDRWMLDGRVRGMVRFIPHDLLREDPPGRFNLVFLRNSVLTYNSEPVRREVLERIRGCLDPPGLLVIGRTEKMPGNVGFEHVSECIYKLPADTS